MLIVGFSFPPGLLGAGREPLAYRQGLCAGGVGRLIDDFAVLRAG